MWLTFLQVLLVLEMKYGEQIKLKIDQDGLLNFKIKAAQQIYIKFAGISAKDLSIPNICLYKYYNLIFYEEIKQWE